MIVGLLEEKSYQELGRIHW